MHLKTVKLWSLDLRYGTLRLTDPTALRRLRESVQQYVPLLRGCPLEWLLGPRRADGIA